MRAMLVLLLVVVGLSTGCSSVDAPGPSSEGSPTATGSTGTSVSAIVGRWERVLTCEELTSELKNAGLGPLMKYA